MCKIILIASVAFLTSCASPKYVYYFESPKNHNDNSVLSNTVGSTTLLTSKDLPTASLDLIIYERRIVAIDTDRVSVDSVPRKKTEAKPSTKSAKPTKKQLYEEKKKAYLEAKKAYAGTKDKRMDGFAVAGAVFFTIAFFCIPNPPVALVFAILGLLSSVLGMKSRIWGMALASLITASVILIFYIYITLLLGGPPE